MTSPLGISNWQKQESQHTETRPTFLKAVVRAVVRKLIVSNESFVLDVKNDLRLVR